MTALFLFLSFLSGGAVTAVFFADWIKDLRMQRDHWHRRYLIESAEKDRRTEKLKPAAPM